MKVREEEDISIVRLSKESVWLLLKRIWFKMEGEREEELGGKMQKSKDEYLILCNSSEKKLKEEQLILRGQIIEKVLSILSKTKPDEANSIAKSERLKILLRLS